MFYKLNNNINSNENYIKEYMINNVADLSNEKKINIYKILFKFNLYISYSYIIKNKKNIYKFY